MEPLDLTETMKPQWHFGSPFIPARAIVLSIMGLAVPVTASWLHAGGTGRFEILVWLPALVPGFLLAYYRGWIGITTGLAMAMALFSSTQVYLIITGQRAPDWPLMLAITVALTLLSLVAGEVTDQLHKAREQAERLALIDPLTNLPNRRYVDLTLHREFAAAQRGRDLVIVAFDLDGLKVINDIHGHAAGDEALKTFAGILRTHTRSMNLSARLGGDEFLSILSSSTIEGALVFVRRVQQATVEATGLATPISVSAGVAEYGLDILDQEHLLDVADQALYDAKQLPSGVVVKSQVKPFAPVVQ